MEYKLNGVDKMSGITGSNEQQMEMAEYQELINRVRPKHNFLKNAILAFLVGGSICLIGQFILQIYTVQGLEQQQAQAATSATMVFLGAFLTGIGVYDRIGKFGGAGSIVPITGFANSIVAPAMEARREGFVFGIGAKMFTIAGPVLVYGFLISALIGISYFLLR
jgi:stage V sporulation protein AC